MRGATPGSYLDVVVDVDVHVHDHDHARCPVAEADPQESSANPLPKGPRCSEPVAAWG